MNDGNEKAALAFSEPNQVTNAQLLEGFRRMDDVFSAVLRSWDANKVTRPTFDELESPDADIFALGFLSTFTFDGVDRIARAEINTPNHGATLDLIVSMPQPFLVAIPAELEGKDSSLNALAVEMPVLSGFAAAFFRYNKHVAVNVYTERKDQRLAITCSCKGIDERLVAKFGFRRR